MNYESLTEKVEALEIEVLESEEKEKEKTIETERIIVNNQENENVNSLNLEQEQKQEQEQEQELEIKLIERPQTSPPILYSLKNNLKENESKNDEKSKPSLLDRMQKSLGFFFKCARCDDKSEEEDVNYLSKCKLKNKNLRNNNEKRTQQQQKHQFSLPIRSKTPEITKKNINSQQHQMKTQIPVPVQVQPIGINSFVTKIDESDVVNVNNSVKCVEIIKKLPQYYEVSGPKKNLLGPINEDDKNFGKKCLVLDLDETLVHSSFYVPEVHDFVVCLALPDGSQQNIYVAKRPGVDEFLAEVIEKFEVVIFTASLAHYADPVIDFLCAGMNKVLKEPKTIDLRLYRDSCLFLRGLYVKDLSRLGRNLEQTVIVDNSPASFLLHPEQGIPIKSWFSDEKDRELGGLMESLRRLVEAESVSYWRSSMKRINN